MLDAAEAARRRELHQRVYAPGGSLSDAELAELHDLDNRNLITREPVASPEPAEPPVRGAQHAAWDPEDAASRDPRADEGSASADSAADSTLDPTLDPTLVRGAQHAASGPEVTASRDLRTEGAGTPRRRWLLPLVAGIAALVGLGAGWLLFGPGDGRTALTAAQQEVWSDLEATGDYDPGSIHVVGEKYGATSWMATREYSKRTCIILTRKDLDPATACRSSTGDYEGFDLQVSLDYTEDGDQYMIFATLIEDAAGHPVTIIQQQNMTEGGWDWRSQYSKDELAEIELLEATGLDGQSLNLLGYDGTTPVWLELSEQTCVIVVQNRADVVQQCGTLATDPEQPLQLAVDDVIYSVIDSIRGPLLTIIRSSATSQLTCDTETGDCTWVDDTPVDVG